MSLLNISCKKATYLISKKEEHTLSWLDKIRLRGHLTMCSLCLRFERQSGFIGRNARYLHKHLHARLSPEAKERIQDILKD